MTDRPPTRRLTLGDLATLIATTALGFWILKTAQDLRGPLPMVPGGNSLSWKDAYGLAASAFLLTTSAGLLIVRMFQPRPPVREVLRQPGSIACLAILGDFLLNATFQFGFIRIAAAHGYIFPFGLASLLFNALRSGSAVAFSWGTLAIAGVWRAEPTWVDRAARVLGVLTILLWVAERLSL